MQVAYQPSWPSPTFVPTGRSAFKAWLVPESGGRPRLAAVAMLLVLGNFALVYWHTFLLAHFAVGWTPDRILRFAVGVSIIPFLAALLISLRLVKLGGLLLFSIFAFAFVIGVAEHFVNAGPANALHHGPGPWTTAFSVSVVLLIVVHVFACSFAVWAMRRPPLPRA